MNNYSFWKLLVRQWSWKNDRWSSLLIGVFVGCINLINIKIECLSSCTENAIVFYYGALFIIAFLWGVFTYHALKLIFMLIGCLIAVEEAKKGNPNLYNEAWNWRQ